MAPSSHLTDSTPQERSCVIASPSPKRLSSFAAFSPAGVWRLSRTDATSAIARAHHRKVENHFLLQTVSRLDSLANTLQQRTPICFEFTRQDGSERGRAITNSGINNR